MACGRCQQKAAERRARQEAARAARAEARAAEQQARAERAAKTTKGA